MAPVAINCRQNDVTVAQCTATASCKGTNIVVLCNFHATQIQDSRPRSRSITIG